VDYSLHRFELRMPLRAVDRLLPTTIIYDKLRIVRCSVSLV